MQSKKRQTKFRCIGTLSEPYMVILRKTHTGHLTQTMLAVFWHVKFWLTHGGAVYILSF